MKLKRESSIYPFWFVLPSLIIFAVFFLYPNRDLPVLQHDGVELRFGDIHGA